MRGLLPHWCKNSCCRDVQRIDTAHNAQETGGLLESILSRQGGGVQLVFAGGEHAMKIVTGFWFFT